MSETTIKIDQADSSKPFDNANSTTEDGKPLKLQLDESEIPEISIDVSKLDSTIEGKNKSLMMTTSNVEHIANDTALTTITNNSESTSSTLNSNINEATLKSKSKLNYVWVSNVRTGIKATDLKKFFSQIGKVTAVKVLTNGKNFYGYVSMETAELAAKCISELNESLFQGEKITVSSKRPDLVSEKAEIAKKKGSVKNVDKCASETNLAKDVTDNKTGNIKKPESQTHKDNLDQQKQLQTKIDSLTHSNKKLKRRLEEIQHSYDSILKKYIDVNKELNTVKFENREDHRRLNQDKIAFEKNRKLELAKVDANKAILEKELADVKKLKETLKRKIDEVRFESKKSFKRERSPLRVNKSPRRRVSPDPRTGGFYRAEQRADKKYRRGFSRERTPSPPNLNADIGKKRPEVNTMPANRAPYFNPNPKPQNFDYRPNRPAPSYQAPRSGWTGYPRNVRRPNSNNGDGNTNPNSRYNGAEAVQHPASAIVVPPRAPHGSYYYPQW